MKKSYFFFIFIFLIPSILYATEIILKPLSKIYFHQFFINNLFPFKDVSLPLLLDKETRFKLLEEYDYDNGFINDICKVQIVSGENKGKIGFVRESKLALDMDLKKNSVYVIIKDDKNFNDYRITEKNTKCQIIDSETSSGREILTLKIENGEYKNTIIHISDKKYFRFVINKKAELYYYINKGYKIIKVIDSVSLNPISGAIADSKYISNNDGIILYKDFPSDTITITKKSYSVAYLNNIKENEEVILAFLTKITYKIFDKHSIFEFEDNNVNIKIFSSENFDFFCLPFVDESSDNKILSIISAFFVENQSTDINIKCYINNQKENQYLQHFNLKTYQWENIIPQIDSNYYYLSKGGYYRLIQNSIATAENKAIVSIDIDKIKKKSSRIFFRNQTGTTVTQGPSMGNTTLIKDKYEYLFFTPDNPITVYQGFFYLSKSKEQFIFPKIKLADESKSLDKIFYGEWRRAAVFLYNHLIQKPKPLMEFLGNIKIYNDNNIKFFIDNYEMQGYFKRIEENKLYIILSFISKKVMNNNNKQIYRITPSFFDTNFIIPAYFWQEASVLKISFDSVYFLRKRIFTPAKQSNQNDYILMDSYPFGQYAFPSDKNKAKFLLFFDLVF